MNEKEDWKDEQGLVFALKETQISIIYDVIEYQRMILTNYWCREKGNSDWTEVKKKQLQMGGILVSREGWGQPCATPEARK